MSSECHSCDCAEDIIQVYFYFVSFMDVLWSIDRTIEDVIVIAILKDLIWKAIRCALTLQQSQFSTISGPTLTIHVQVYKKEFVDCKKKKLLRQTLNC
jgi:hypothetical protein